MTRTTIDHGIDLGTTNSAVAVLNETTSEIIDNNQGQKYTPSAIWIDDKGKLHVGSAAKNYLIEDEENAYSEFKLQMGKDITYSFEKTGIKMKPEELSAEVLKELKADIQQRTGEDINAAAISVPAAFDLSQCEATKQAARLSGIKTSPLLQEPVAAAMAYGFQSQSDRVFWLVYDFGGGTFDAAIINVRDGLIHVVNHGGDNHLGGKLIDWEIVQQHMVPVIEKEYNLHDFNRGNRKYATAFAKLKHHAEEAKIRLSRHSSTPVDINPLCYDEKGQPVNFSHELKREDLEKIIEPFVMRSINICKKVMTEKSLDSSDIEKTLLVGGPTLTPVFREMLAEYLNIPLEFKIDPLTVVARGAAIFAGTQRLERDSTQAKAKEGNIYLVNLEYSPVDSDPEPLVGGKVVSPKNENLNGYTIEFIENKSQWRSGKVILSENGSFMTTLKAEAKRRNDYKIELRESTGTLCNTDPEMFSYTIGLSITDPPLIHSLGVALANNETQVFLSKGKPLPARRKEVHRTTIDVKKGQSQALLQIPIVEGENTRRADRNRLIGVLKVPGDKVHRDVPAGSEVEITIEVDQSRLVRTFAYIPILDEEYDGVHSLTKSSTEHSELNKEFDKEKERFNQLKESAEKTDAPNVDSLLNKIDEEGMIHDIEVSLNAAETDEDAADKCLNRLLDLKSTLDEIEEAFEWPSLVSSSEETIKEATNILNDYGSASEKNNLKTLKKEVEQAINSRNSVVVESKISEIQALTMKVLVEQPQFWVSYLYYLQDQRQYMSDQSSADQLFSQGHKAVNQNNLEGVKQSVVQLIELLPPEKQADARGYGGTTMPSL